MSRYKRIFEERRWMHVIIRGANKQDFFLDNKDKEKFLKELRKAKENYHFEVYAYVLMPNHVHIHMCDKEENLSKIMQSLQVSYVEYFNKKYKKTGPLYEGRYKSRAVTTTTYFINLVRYIHRNPEKARMELCEKYKWSSYQSYVERGNTKCTLVDCDKFLNMLDEKDIAVAQKKFRMLHQYNEQIDKYTEFTEYEMLRKLTDEKVIEIILEVWKMYPQEIQKCSKKERDRLLTKIANYRNISVKQLSRITGLSVRTIERARTETKK